MGHTEGGLPGQDSDRKAWLGVTQGAGVIGNKQEGKLTVR